MKSKFFSRLTQTILNNQNGLFYSEKQRRCFKAGCALFKEYADKYEIEYDEVGILRTTTFTRMSLHACKESLLKRYATLHKYRIKNHKYISDLKCEIEKFNEMEHVFNRVGAHIPLDTQHGQISLKHEFEIQINTLLEKINYDSDSKNAEYTRLMNEYNKVNGFIRFIDEQVKLINSIKE